MEWFKGNLQETMVFTMVVTMKYRGVLSIFPSKSMKVVTELVCKGLIIDKHVGVAINKTG